MIKMKKLLILLFSLVVLVGCTSTTKPTGTEVTLKQLAYKVMVPNGYKENTSEIKNAGNVVLSAKKENGNAAFGFWAIELNNAISLVEHTQKLPEYTFEKITVNQMEVYRGTQKKTVDTKEAVIYLYLFDYDKHRLIVSSSTTDIDHKAFRDLIEGIIASIKK